MIFWRTTVPHAAPSIISGSVLCWARAPGEFGATVTFAGLDQAPSGAGVPHSSRVRMRPAFEPKGPLAMANR